MARRLVAPFALLAVALLTAGPAAAANPVKVALAPSSSPAGQACVSLTVADSVTGAPLAVDLVLALANGPGSGETPAKTDFSGKGTACFGPTKFGNTVAGIDTVTLCSCNPVVVHASPDYQTTGTSNSVVVSFAGYTPPTAAPTSPNVIASDGWTCTWAPRLVVAARRPAGCDSSQSRVRRRGSTRSHRPSRSISPAPPGRLSRPTADGGSCSGTTTVNCTLPQLSKGGQTGVDLTLVPGAPGQVSVAFVLRFHTMAANGVVFPQSNALAQFNLTAVAPAADLSVALTAAKARVGKARQRHARHPKCRPAKRLGLDGRRDGPGSSGAQAHRRSGGHLSTGHANAAPSPRSARPGSCSRSMPTRAGTAQDHARK